MSTDPKKDERADNEINDEQLEAIAGGDGSVDPTERIFGKKPPIQPEHSEAPD